MPTTMDFASVFAGGLLATIKIALLSLALSAPAGLIIGMARYSRRLYFNIPAMIYIEVFRNSPVLVMILWFYFAFPTIAPFEVDSFVAAVLALSLNTSAFFAEIFRAGIQSIAPGQWEAARALGMTYRMEMQRIILPQAMKRMIPAFTNRWIDMFKLTSLASVVAYHELLHSARSLSSAYYNPVEMFSVAALIYFACVYPMAQFTYWLERRFKRGD